MRAIIDGTAYDTDTATKLGSWYNGCYSSDFDYVQEELYRKRNGEYFLYGEGGAASAYSKACPGGVCGSESIVPLDLDEAEEWAQEHLSAEKYEAAFGPVSEGGSVLIAVNVSEEAAERLNRVAEEKGVTRQSLLAGLVEGLQEPSGE